MDPVTTVYFLVGGKLPSIIPRALDTLPTISKIAQIGSLHAKSSVACDTPIITSVPETVVLNMCLLFFRSLSLPRL